MFSGIMLVLLVGFGFFVIKNYIHFLKEHDELLYSNEYNIREYTVKEKELRKKRGKRALFISVIFILLMLVGFIIRFFI